jgi:hypothetical protein
VSRFTLRTVLIWAVIAAVVVYLAVGFSPELRVILQIFH